MTGVMGMINSNGLPSFCLFQRIAYQRGGVWTDGNIVGVVLGELQTVVAAGGVLVELPPAWFYDIDSDNGTRIEKIEECYLRPIQENEDASCKVN